MIAMAGDRQLDRYLKRQYFGISFPVSDLA